MNFKDLVIERFKKYREHDIIITPHALHQAVFRSIDINDVKDNIMNPRRLVFAGKQSATKFDCYFAYSNTQCQRYVLVLKKKCIVCTVIKINRRWQRMVERYSR